MTSNDDRRDDERTPDMDIEGAEDSVRMGDDDARAAAEDVAFSDDFAQVVRERNEFRDQWERARADYQNLLHRLPRQVDEGVRRELEPRLKDLVQVLDYLEMALASPAESPDAKAIVFGVDMVKKLLVDALGNLGVEPVDVTIGSRLDPAVHEAISSTDFPVNSGGPADGSILSVQKRGYMWKGRPLRHAQVTVARHVAARDAGATNE